MITLVKAAFVIAYEGGDHAIIRDGEVAYEGDSIVYVGKAFPGTPDTVVDVTIKFVGNGVVMLG